MNPQHIDTLSNPRSGFNERKDILQRIIKWSPSDVPPLVDALQMLIQYEDNLRLFAFETLVNVLPANYSKSVPNVSLQIVAKGMADAPIALTRLMALLERDRSVNLVPFVHLAVYRMYTRPSEVDTAVDLLNRIFCLKEYRNVLAPNQVRFVCKFAAESADAAHKKILKGVISRNIPKNQLRPRQMQFFERLNCTLNSDNIENCVELKKIEATIREGFRLSDERIAFIVTRLSNVAFRKDLVRILVTVESKYGIDADARRAFLKMMSGDEALMSLPATSDLLLLWTKRGHSIGEDLVCKWADSTKTTPMWFDLLTYFTGSIKDRHIAIAQKILIDSKQSHAVRCAAAKFLLTRYKIIHNGGHLTNEFQNVALNAKAPNGDVKLNQMMLKILRLNGASLNDDFVKKYYQIVGSALGASVRNALDGYMACGDEERVGLLELLGELSIMNDHIETSVFKEFDVKLWKKELLQSALSIRLVKANGCKSIEEMLDVYVNTVADLSVRLDRDVLVSFFLKILIMENERNLDIRLAMDLLKMAADQKTLDSFMAAPMEIYFDLIAVKRDWLEHRTNNMCLNVEPHQMHVLLAFDVCTMACILEQIRTQQDFDVLMRILALLNYSFPMFKHFLDDWTISNLPVAEWKPKFFSKFVESFLRIKAAKLHQWPDSDVKSAVAKEYRGDYKLVLTLRLRDLAEDLSKAADGKNAFLMLINIQPQYWVVLALVPTKSVALYKDSRGIVDTQKHVESIVQKILPTYKFISSQTQEQLDDFNGLTFAVRNLNIFSNCMKNNCDNFIKGFASWPFTSYKNLDEASKLSLNRIKSNIKKRVPVLCKEFLEILAECAYFKADMEKLVRTQWCLESVICLIDTIHTKDDLKIISDSIDIIWEYDLREYDIDADQCSLYDKICNRVNPDLEKYVHDLAIYKTFGRVEDVYWQAGDTISFDIKNMSMPRAEKMSALKKVMESTSCSTVTCEDLLLDLLPCSRGTVLEIGDGSSKSATIAMAAALLVSEGRNVAIITSGVNRSQHNYERYSAFYSALKIDVMLMSTRGNASVEYGHLADLLPHIKNRTLKWDVILMDDITALMADADCHVIERFHSIPGMVHLLVIMAAIWYQVNTIVACTMEESGVAYLIKKDTTVDEDVQTIEERNIPLKSSREDFIAHCTDIHIRQLLKEIGTGDALTTTEPLTISMPNHLKEFVLQVQLPKWIRSALDAKLWLQQNRHYDIKDGCIVVVGSSKSNTAQESMFWSDGLLQFLQLKHGLKFTAENMGVHYVSNVTFFKKFEQNIFALADSSTCKANKDFLKGFYDIDWIEFHPSEIPTRRLKELPSASGADSKAWLTEIVQNTIKKLKYGRTVVVLLENDLFMPSLIDLFNAEGCSDVKINCGGGPSTVIMTAGSVMLMGGSPSDWKVLNVDDEADANGGLHVCYTYLPIDVDSEGRFYEESGCKGTIQFILYDESSRNTKLLRTIRDQQLDKYILHIKSELYRNSVRDSVYQKFSDFHDELIRKDRKADAEDAEMGFFLWLNKFEVTKRQFKDAHRQFDIFKRDFLNGNSPKCPNFYLMNGHYKMKYRKYMDAIENYDRVIKMDSNFAENAYYAKGYCLIAQFGNDTKKNEKMILQAVNCFHLARYLFEERLKYLLYVQSVSDSEVISRQIADWVDKIQMLIDSIDCAIGIDMNCFMEGIQHVSDLDSNDGESLKFSTFNGGVIGNAISKEKNLQFALKPFDGDNKEDLREMGYIGIISVCQIEPVVSRMDVGLLVAGLVQLVIGATIGVFSLGALTDLDSKIIREGIDDVTEALRSDAHEDFDWNSWLIRKTVYFATSVACAGMRVIKHAAKTLYECDYELNDNVKQGWRLVVSRIVLELSKGIAKETTDELIRRRFARFVVPKIKERISELVEELAEKQGLADNETLAKLDSLDIKCRNVFYENFLKELKSGDSFIPQQNQLLVFASNIAGEILSNGTKGFSVARQVIKAIQAVESIRSYIPDLLKRINEIIDEVADRKKLFERHNEKLEICKKHLKPANKGENALDTVRQIIIQKISDDLTHKIVNTIVTPTLNNIVSSGVNALTSSIEQSHKRQVHTYKAERRIIYGWKCDDNEDDFNRSPDALEHADKIIRDLDEGGEGGLVHLGALSEAIGRPICVFDASTGSKVYTVGDKKIAPPVNIEHDANGRHWRLVGGKEPAKHDGSKDCLFEAIAEQTNHDSVVLRRSCVAILKSRRKRLADRSLDLKRLAAYKEAALRLGGAKYTGTSPHDSKMILDQSQGVRGYAFPSQGHSRGHASENSTPPQPGNNDCVENYSYTGRKSAFLSRQDQDTYAHYALLDTRSQRAMARLNSGSQREAVDVPVSSLTSFQRDSSVNAGTWSQGVMVGTPYMSPTIKLVLQHQQGSQNNPDADVHILTLYPVFN